MSDRKITVKSGNEANEEFTMDVTKEEYHRYYHPWWQQKKRGRRNREVMEQNGYTEESYHPPSGGFPEAPSSRLEE